MTADVAKEEDCKAIVDKSIEEFGGVDILILNAAYAPLPQWFSDYDNPVSCTRVPELTMLHVILFSDCISSHVGRQILKCFQVSYHWLT